MIGPDGLPTRRSASTCWVVGRRSARQHRRLPRQRHLHADGHARTRDKCDGTVAEARDRLRVERSTRRCRDRAARADAADAPAELVLDDHAAAQLRRQPGRAGLRDQVRQGRRAQPGRQPQLARAQGRLPRPTTGKVELIGSREPGAYTIVARARSTATTTRRGARRRTSTLIAPFDISSRRSPTRAARATRSARDARRAAAAGGRVTVAVAKGKKGKRFRTLGKPKVNSKGQLQAALPALARHLPRALLVQGQLGDGPRARSTRSSRITPRPRLARAARRIGSRGSRSRLPMIAGMTLR